jgi:thiol:disulfide interchange protein DsbD
MPRLSFFFGFLLFASAVFAQDTTLYNWKVAGKKVGPSQYELRFTTMGASSWELYTPDQLLSDVPAAEIQFNDSSVRSGAFKSSGVSKALKSALFEEALVKVEEGATAWTVLVTIDGAVPANLRGTLLYTYGRDEELYPSTPFNFSVPLEGGVTANGRIKIASIDLANPVAPCGDANTADNSLWSLFFIGFGAGLLALLFPCIFPLIPLTVSFFTKRSKSRRKGITNALLYGFSIFFIYAALSLPFHLFNVRPEILNNISTNVPLNVAFFVVFIVFAISFFGYFEIGLPSNFATKVDSKSGISDIWGIFFMALTLAVVSFSCTSGILGALLVGAFSSEGGAWQLTAGMAGFGAGLGLPFVLFALFPNWLQSLPKSGGWMNELKVVFGFIELAMAIKFLSNADLVKQWGLLKREVFLGAWVLIGIAIVLYLLGVINFAHDSKRKFTPVRWGFIALFGAITLYLIPGMFNTKSAGLTMISGFPPPVTYTIYKHSVLRENSIEPLHNDYEKALQLARQLGKPVLIDFTGWACVNCRRMEEKVWTDPEVAEMMRNDFVVVSLYVDERKKLPAAEQTEYLSGGGEKRSIVTVGDKWATFQSENFGAVSQPQYAILSPDEKALTRTKSYTQSPSDFKEWLQCGLNAYQKVNGK